MWLSDYGNDGRDRSAEVLGLCDGSCAPRVVDLSHEVKMVLSAISVTITTSRTKSMKSRPYPCLWKKRSRSSTDGPGEIAGLGGIVQ